LPQTAGRPATIGQQPARAAPAGQQPKPPLRPAQAAYPSQGYSADTQAAALRDPYAALRPDGYGYGSAPHGAPAQPADPYGLAGYTAPQAPAGQGYATQPAQTSPYGQGGYDPYQQQRTQPPQAGAQFGQPGPSFAAQPQPYGGNGYAPAQPAAPLADSWGTQGLAADPRDYGQGTGYANQGQGLQGHWDGADPYFSEHGAEPSLTAGGYQQGAQQGSFDQSYADDDAQYEDEPRGGGWKKIVGVVACMAIVGGVLTLAYTTIMGHGSGPTPVVKSAAGPSKVKPSEPGGKQFAYTDSKVMGRLGDGGSTSADANAETDAGNGVRKVPVMVVGRDGSIQAPSAVEPPEQAHASVGVPGLTVTGGFGDGGPHKTESKESASAASPTVKMVTGSGAKREGDDTPAKSAKAVKADASGSDEAGAAPLKAVVKEAPASTPKKEKVAALPAATAAGPQPTGAGYVAVLASVPASGSSRIDALKKFADMQQKYTSILQNKTPDVQEADLGAKGTYHRLLVGPPGSRDSANAVCSQLKVEGYSGCWVTAY
jgi:hypothetical protein